MSKAITIYTATWGPKKVGCISDLYVCFICFVNPELQVGLVPTYIYVFGPKMFWTGPTL
jgi:hypothetical protein